MRYFIYILFLSVLIFSAAWAYRVNYETRDVVNNLKSLRLEIALQEEKRNMLQGEWAFLNRPERLSRLSEKFFSDLKLMPMSAENFASLNAIRMKTPTSEYDYKEKFIFDEVNVTPGVNE